MDSDALAKALGRVSSGLYIVTTGVGPRATGFLGSWVMQAGFTPPAVTVAIQKDRAVLQIVRECGHFCVSVLAPSCRHFLKHFARSVRPEDEPFKGIKTALARSGVPYLTDAHAFLECSVLGESTWSDHTIVCGEVVGGGSASFGENPLIHVRTNGSSY